MNRIEKNHEVVREIALEVNSYSHSRLDLLMVDAAYGPFIKETKAQMRALQADGWKVSIVTSQYQTSWDMFWDMHNKELLVWNGGQFFDGSNPMAYLSGVADKYCTPMRTNEVFRAVHDITGHWGDGDTLHPFETFMGEILAWERHSRLYTLEAQRALFSETIGQLCYHATYGKFPEVQPYGLVSEPAMNRFLEALD